MLCRWRNMISAQEDHGKRDDTPLAADSDSDEEAACAPQSPPPRKPPSAALLRGPLVGQFAACSAPQQMWDSTPMTADSDSEEEAACTPQPPPPPQPPAAALQKTAEAVSLLPLGGGLVEQLAACRERVQTLEKLLNQSQTQNQSVYLYNQDLRKQVDQLSLEIHKWRKRDRTKTVNAEVQTEYCAAWSHPDYSSHSQEYHYPSTDVTENTVPTNLESKCTASTATDQFATGTSVHTNTYSVANGQNVQTPDPAMVPNSKEGKGASLAEMLRATAEAVVSQTGFTYDETTGWYFDHSTGYYYDSENQLYYDANTGIYYCCDAETGNYVFHSQIDLPASQTTPELKKEPNRLLKRRMSVEHTESFGNELILDPNTGIYYYCHPVTGRLMFHSHVDDPATSQVDKRTAVKKKRLEDSGTPAAEAKEIKAEDHTTPINQTFHYAAPPVSKLYDKKTAKEKKRTKLGTVLHKALKHEDLLPCENGISDQNKISNERSSFVAESGSDAESSEAEEGEIAVSEGDEECSEDNYSVDMEISTDSEDTENEESDGLWPPCIRVIVVRSPVLETGTLFIITSVQHATIGRDNDMEHAVHIPEPGVSEFHAEVYFDHKLASYVLVDQGSETGTVINGSQILQPSVICAPCVLKHGDEVKFGETVLSFHMHPGSQTCNGCEPGQIQAFLGLKKKQEAPSAVKIMTKEEKRRLELKQLRQKYGLQNAPYEESKAVKNPNYVDRAGRRRKTVGSEGTFQRDDAPASVHVAITETNKGHKMLKKMGWKKGEGLGKNKAGIKDPIQLQIRKKKAGLGAVMASSIEDIPISTQNKLNWEKARERFVKTFGMSLS